MLFVCFFNSIFFVLFILNMCSAVIDNIIYSLENNNNRIKWFEALFCEESLRT